MSQNLAIEPTELIWGNLAPTLEMQTELFEEAEELFEEGELKEIIREPIGGIFTMLVAEMV